MINFDCHAHVFDKISVISGARYIPKRPAPLDIWLQHQATHGLQGGVVVQPSFLGTDNSELCAVLAKLDLRIFAGVAVVPMDISVEDLNELVGKGIRGVRWNLVRGAELPHLDAAETQLFFSRLRARALHLEIHLEGSRLAPSLPQLLGQGVKVVLDHFGLPSDPDPKADPMIAAVQGISDRSALYFKFSADYRTPFDVRPHADALRSLLPADRVVWGSDWPHTQHENSVAFAETYGTEILARDLSDTIAAKALYGISAH